MRLLGTAEAIGATVRPVKLSSMLVPLQTLSGWPAAPNPTVLETLGLLVGLPLVVIVIAFAVARAGNMIKAGRAGDRQVADAIWVGGRRNAGALGGDVGGDVPALESGETGSSFGATAETAAGGSTEQTGGAGARW